MSVLTKEITLPRLRRTKPGASEEPAAGPGSAVEASPEVPKQDGSAPKLAHFRRLHRPVGGWRSGLGRRQSKTVTGLEIGATQLIAAQAHLEDGRIVTDRLAARPIPAGLVRDGLVLDVDGLAAELRAMFSEHRLGRRVRVGLATPRTVLRVIDVPPVEEADVTAILPALAQPTMPMPLEDAALDHTSIGLVDTPEGRRLRLIVVAAEGKGVTTLAETVQRAGLRPVGIDLSVFAVTRAVPLAPTPEPVLYAQLGDLVSLAISEAGICRFTRQAPQGMALILGRLAEQRDITLAAAQTLLAAVTGPDGTDADPRNAREIHTLIGRVAHELGAELRTTVEFYATQFGARVDRGVVTGGMAALPGFVDALAEASAMSLTAGAVEVPEAQRPAAVDPRVAAVAAGLSVGALAS